jgi:hypothetical protein
MTKLLSKTVSNKPLGPKRASQVTANTKRQTQKEQPKNVW